MLTQRMRERVNERETSDYYEQTSRSGQSNKHILLLLLLLVLAAFPSNCAHTHMHRIATITVLTRALRLRECRDNSFVVNHIMNDPYVLYKLKRAENRNRTMFWCFCFCDRHHRRRRFFRHCYLPCKINNKPL